YVTCSARLYLLYALRLSIVYSPSGVRSSPSRSFAPFGFDPRLTWYERSGLPFRRSVSCRADFWTRTLSASTAALPVVAVTRQTVTMSARLTSRNTYTAMKGLLPLGNLPWFEGKVSPRV